MPFRECFQFRDGLAVDLQPFHHDTAALAAAFQQFGAPPMMTTEHCARGSPGSGSI
jgi:hypothetical protein